MLKAARKNEKRKEKGRCNDTAPMPRCSALLSPVTGQRNYFSFCKTKRGDVKGLLEKNAEKRVTSFCKTSLFFFDLRVQRILLPFALQQRDRDVEGPLRRGRKYCSIFDATFRRCLKLENGRKQQKDTATGVGIAVTSTLKRDDIIRWPNGSATSKKS